MYFHFPTMITEFVEFNYVIFIIVWLKNLHTNFTLINNDTEFYNYVYEVRKNASMLIIV